MSVFNLKAGAFNTRVLASLFALPLLSMPALPQDAIVETIDPNVTAYTLANGLTVALAPSKTAQSVALVTHYKIGSANEAPGRSGFAHLFEHLMFEGTKAVPDFDQAISSVGGQNNAFTQRDSTTYYMTGPAEALPLFLRLDADRMANLANAVSQEDLDNQRAIVLNEMRQNVLDQPGGAAREQTETALYPSTHPYGHSTIGSIADLGAAKLEDVIAFHRINYIPANAHIAITGNFDIEKAKAWIDQTFAKVPNATPTPIAEVSDISVTTKRLEFSDEVPTPVVMLQWPGPRGFSKQTVTNAMMAGAMSVGKGAFDNRLVVQEGVASSVNAYWSDGELGGSFKVLASAAQGVSAEKLEAAMRKTLDAMRNEGFNEDTLKIVRTDLETGYSSVPSNPVGFAIALAQSAANDDARTWRGEVDVAKTVTAADVSAALRAFPNDTAQVSIIAPGPRNTNYPPTIANSTGTSAPMITQARADIVIPEITLEKAADIVFPPSETRTLASGATLVSYTINDPAKVGISLITPGGSLDAPPALSDLAMAVTSRGVGDLSLAATDERYRTSGISVNGGAGRHYSQVRGSAPVQNFEALATQLAEAIMNPRFDDNEWAAAIDQTVNAVEASKKSPDYNAMRALRTALYPSGAPELNEPDVAQIKQFKSVDAQAVYLQQMRPDKATFHVASNLPIETIVATLDKAFLGWTPKPNPLALKGYSLPTVKDVYQTSQVDGATQTAILAAIAAPDEGSKDSIAFGLAAHVLGGDAGSRLNAVLREEKGWSYGIGAYVNGDKARNNSLLLVSTTVQSDQTQDSLKEIKRIIAELSDKPITEQEYETARRTIKAQFLNAFDSAPGMVGWAAALFSQGYQLEDLKKYLQDIDSVTLEMVNAQAQRIAKSPIALSIAGDKALMK